MLLKKDIISRQSFLYTLILSTGYVFDFIIFTILIFFEFDSIFSYVISFFLGTVVNVILLRGYFMKAKFSFFKDLSLTVFANSFVMLIGLGLFTLLFRSIGFNVIFAKIISNIATFLINYLTRRAFF
jgi:hypothetical protein